MRKAKASMDCPWLYTLLDDALARGRVLGEGRALRNRYGYWNCQENLIQCVPLTVWLVLTIVVWRWDGALHGELAVIDDLRSLASLWVPGRGVGLIDDLVELHSFFRSFCSSTLPSLTDFFFSFLPPHLALGSCSLRLLPRRQDVFSLASFVLLPEIVDSLSLYSFWLVSSLVWVWCPLVRLNLVIPG